MSASEKPVFFWGAATAAHQVEGNNTHNDWWAFEQSGGVKYPSGLACDQYRRFREDFEILTKLGHTAHRFSIEWSRLEPRENEWNEEAFLHYEEVLQELCRRGIEPIVTLHHFTNPIWFAEKGSWLHPEAPAYFARYTKKAVERFAPYVKYWITINEPVVFLYHSYCTGLWPPGEKSFKKAIRVFRQLARGHVAAYREIHAHYESMRRPVWVSIAKHMSDFSPCNPKSSRDRFFTVLRNWFFNHLFLHALMKGFLFFPGIYCEFLSSYPTLDFIGVNYYSRYFVRGTREGPTPMGADCTQKHHPEHTNELNVMGWEVYPGGLTHVLLSLKRYRLPVMICENGICAAEDPQRESFIRRHVAAVQKAQEQGVPIWGYLYWSFLDNFEWAEGFGPRFGIVEVDYETQARKIRPSAYVLTELCRKWSDNTLPFS